MVGKKEERRGSSESLSERSLTSLAVTDRLPGLAWHGLGSAWFGGRRRRRRKGEATADFGRKAATDGIASEATSG